MEGFERASLDLQATVSVSRQILIWYAKVKKICVDPISDQKFIREIIRKLPREVRGILICNRERPISDFAAKVAEIMIEGGYSKSDLGARMYKGNGSYADCVRYGGNQQRF